MNAAEFDDQFNRVTAHFHLPTDASRETVAMEWFRAVEHYHVDALDHAVTQIIRQATDRFWPPLGKLLEIIRGRIAGMDKTRDKCATCHGSTWIDAWPYQLNGLVYTGVMRCPDCGVPAPVEMKANSYRKPLTKAEYHAWREGMFGRDAMPDGLKAKHPTRKNPEMAALIEKFANKFLRDGAA